MRIGHYAPDIWAQGGIASYIRRLGAAQAEAGHSVFFLSRRPSPECTSEAEVIVPNEKCLFEEARGICLDLLHLHKPVRHLPVDRVPTVRTMHGNQGGCPSGTRYLARSGVPCERTYSLPGCLWGHLVDQCGSRRPYKIQASFRSIQREIKLVSDVNTYAVSQYIRDQMLRSGCPPEKLHAITSPAPNCTEDYTPPPPTGVPRFVFAGRLVPQKGILWLLQAFAKVQAQVHLDVAGDGPMVSSLRQLTEELGLVEQVTFHGWIPLSRIKEIILAARAVIVPSVWQEPAGLATLEAAAYGRPVIASRVGGIPEYATCDFARLVPPNDELLLAEEITLLAEDWNLADKLGRAGRTAAQTRFSMDAFLEKLEEFYAIAAGEEVSVAVE